MKCTCDTCKGNGTIPCPDCNGQGECLEGIENALLNLDMPHFVQLSELQRDGRRVIRDAAKLCAMNPDHSNAYQEQLKAALETINAMADRVVKSKG